MAHNHYSNTAAAAAGGPQGTMVRIPPTPEADPLPLFDLCLIVPHPAASKLNHSTATNTASDVGVGGLISIPSPAPASAALVKELQENLLGQISRFCFPEYEEPAPQPAAVLQSMPVNKYDVYPMQSPSASFQHFTFSMQLSTGVRLHGHVRRYLPPHPMARTRYDMGRRGERAICLLTRASGADLLYAAILKSLDAISSQQAVMSAKGLPLPHEGKAQIWFLHTLYQHQQHLAAQYKNKTGEERGIPLEAAIQGLELGPKPAYNDVDVSLFLFPPAMLHGPPLSSKLSTSSSEASSMLPLLRCVGVNHALRILAALLSERRVIMVSASPTRLTICSHAAVSILAQGALHWQHLYIPVLPPHLWDYLAAPYPYLIGVLQPALPRLERTDGLAEVLIIHLDNNTMETRGMDPSTIGQRLPDLFQATSNIMNDPYGGGQSGVVGACTASEYLAQDLTEVLRTDKRVLYGQETNVMANMGETAAKAGKAMKGAFVKLRDKGKQYLNKAASTRQGSSSFSEDIPEDNTNSSMNNEQAAADVKSISGDYIYTEACHNEMGEEEARIAFASFFLCMLGDIRWYLTAQPGQAAPILDRKKFLQTKRTQGEGEGTAIWPLLLNLTQTQMLEEFAKARTEELRTQQAATADAPLFLQCQQYHRQHNVDFGVLSVRNTVQQIARRSNVGRLTNGSARRDAMLLTSNKPYEGPGTVHQAIAKLVKECRESSAVLFDVMSVVWLRLRDSRGMMWKHGLSALQILKNLLYHGPLSAIAEATDGLAQIRSLKYYQHMRQQIMTDVRAAASTVYNLLVDRAKLFHVRRVCAEKRRSLLYPPPRLVRDQRLNFNVAFRSIHQAFHPSARGTIVRIPPVQQTMQRGGPPPQQSQQQVQRQQPQPQQQVAEVDLFGFSSPAPAPASVPPSQPTLNDDMMGLFDAFAISTPSPIPAQQHQPGPTMVVLPPVATSDPSLAANRSRTASTASSGSFPSQHNQQLPPSPANSAGYPSFAQPAQQMRASPPDTAAYPSFAQPPQQPSPLAMQSFAAQPSAQPPQPIYTGGPPPQFAAPPPPQQQQQPPYYQQGAAPFQQQQSQPPPVNNRGPGAPSTNMYPPQQAPGAMMYTQHQAPPMPYGGNAPPGPPPVNPYSPYPGGPPPPQQQAQPGYNPYPPGPGGYPPPQQQQKQLAGGYGAPPQQQQAPPPPPAQQNYKQFDPFA